MGENSRAVLALTVGAVAGALAGFMLFTDRGRDVRRQLELALEDIARELGRFRGTVRKATEVASEGWKLLNDAIGDREPPYGTPRQSSPF